MSFESKITKSIWGREMGIQRMSSVEIGTTGGPKGFLAGVEDLRKRTTSATTGTIMPPYGLDILTTGSSAVHHLGPPIPGIAKQVYSSGGATCYVVTDSATIVSSQGTTDAAIAFVSQGLVTLMGVSTAVWAVVGQLTTAGGIDLAAST